MVPGDCHKERDKGFPTKATYAHAKFPQSTQASEKQEDQSG